MSMAEDTRKRADYSDDHSSSEPRSSGGDPLAELARLIGQSDPFNDLSRRSVRKPDSLKSEDRPAPEWLARPAAPDHDDYDVQPPHQVYAQPNYRAEDQVRRAPAPSYRPQAEHPVEHYADDQRPEGEHAEYAGHEDYQPDDRYRVALPSAQYESDSYYAEDGHLPPQGEEGVITRRRGGMLTIAAVLGLAVIGTAGAFGYRAFTSGGSTHGTPPVIKADPTPPKTIPAPTTTASTDSKPFQDRVGAPASAEKMVPREEQPVSLPIAPAPATPRVTAPQPSAQAAAPLVSPPAPTSVNEPKKVKTMIIRPDNSATDSNAMASAPVAAPPVQSRAPATKQSGASPMAIAPASEPSSRTKVASRTPAATGAYVVQVSAQRTEAEAQSSYQALQTKYPSVLGGRNANFRRVDLGDKGGVFYRAQVGSFATSEQAMAFCNSLKDVGGQCIVQKN